MTDTHATPPPVSDAIRSARFRKERETSWKRLDALVVEAEKRGVRNMSYQDTLALPSLYRQAMNSLSVARAISLDQALLAYLEALCARAYLVIYAPQESVRDALVKLFTQYIPQAVRNSALALAIGFLAMALGAFTGYMLFFDDPSWFYSFVPSSLSDGRTPEASASYLRSTLFDDNPRAHEMLGAFAGPALFAQHPDRHPDLCAGHFRQPAELCPDLLQRSGARRVLCHVCQGRARL